MNGLAVALAVGWRSWLKAVRRPVALTFSFAQPVIWMLLFGFLFASYRIARIGFVGNYLDYLVPGVCTMTVLFGASQCGVELIRDMQTGFLMRMLRAPSARPWILAGKLGADVLRLLVQALGVLLVGVLLGAHLAPSPGSVPLAVLGLALFGAALGSLSCAIALTARRPESMAVFVHLVNMPLLFSSTALVPAAHMPPALAAVARVNPLSLAVDGLRGALSSGAPPALATQTLPLFAIAIVLFVVALGALRRLVAPRR